MKRIVFAVIAITGILLLVGCTTSTDTTTYTVTVSSIGADSGESVTADVSEAAEGDTVTLTAALNSGRRVALSASGVAISPSTISTNGDTATFTMPAAAVEITATFSVIPLATESGFTGTLAIGDVGTVTLSSESLIMIYANDSSSITFPTGTDDSGSATLTTKFWIAETEVTNAVMAEVFQWAYDNGKFSGAGSDPNGLDTTTAKHGGQQLLDLDDIDCRVDYDGSGTFSAESGYENNPVTNVTWYGAVMFCNWLTEMRDGNTDNVVYVWTDNGDGEGTASDGIWQDDETDENTTSNGYRLPSSDEWEYAARYRGTDSMNTVSSYSHPYYTKGNSASGAVADYNDAAACQAVAVYSGQNPRPTYEAEVKSLGTGSANALGLYDMSGNVEEWCFTESGSYRFKRGGSFDDDSGASALQIGDWSIDDPVGEFENRGFRLCRTAD